MYKTEEKVTDLNVLVLVNEINFVGGLGGRIL